LLTKRGLIKVKNNQIDKEEIEIIENLDDEKDTHKDKIVYPKGWIAFMIVLLTLIIALSIVIYLLPKEVL
jgi:zona occludens toxin (predicted ATPase)